MLRVLFVCTGNTCRSPMAEALFRHMIQKENKEKDIMMISAGLAVWEDSSASKQAIEIMRKQGIDLSAHRSRALTPELVRAADIILTMTSGHKQTVLGMAPESKEKVFTLSEFAGDAYNDISDPFGATEETYQACADEINGHLTKSWQKLLEFRKENAGENTSA